MAEYRIASQPIFDADSPMLEGVHIRRGTRARFAFLPDPMRDDPAARAEFASRYRRPPKLIGPHWLKVSWLEMGSAPVAVKEYMPGRLLPEWLTVKRRALLPRLNAAVSIAAALADIEASGAAIPEIKAEAIFLGPQVAVILGMIPGDRDRPLSYLQAAIGTIWPPFFGRYLPRI